MTARQLNEGLGLVPEREMLDALAAQALVQIEKARDFPRNTCGPSRHLALLAEAILRSQPCPQWTEDPQNCAESMAWTVAALWDARTELAALREQVAALHLRGEASRLRKAAPHGET